MNKDEKNMIFDKKSNNLKKFPKIDSSNKISNIKKVTDKIINNNNKIKQESQKNISNLFNKPFNNLKSARPNPKIIKDSEHQRIRSIFKNDNNITKNTENSKKSKTLLNINRKNTPQILKIIRKNSGKIISKEINKEQKIKERNIISQRILNK